jgi:hypothetical protein
MASQGGRRRKLCSWPFVAKRLSMPCVHSSWVPASPMVLRLLATSRAHDSALLW